MTGCKPVDTPVEYNAKLGDKNDRIPVNKERYQRFVGKLIYLSHTRPDISYTVSVVSQFMQAPCEDHMTVVELFFGSVVDRKSMSGYCTFVWRNLVIWRSKKQGVITKSSVEAEYRAMSLGICEKIWLKKVLSDLQ
ncbi:uncharacterized mitochondrial protein AtMg00810-like [Benincasa hispida]|uniref:uncharacterized mitochondrial protein AtMg00810-like n=1 Tax=Benincasa hispida TaxID=102211 RepID=UPI001900663D|nr:uncharacterized mitochondrial protein AtMg00810-like [Benincasa hispida]